MVFDSEYFFLSFFTVDKLVDKVRKVIKNYFKIFMNYRFVRENKFI